MKKTIGFILIVSLIAISTFAKIQSDYTFGNTVLGSCDSPNGNYIRYRNSILTITMEKSVAKNEFRILVQNLPWYVSNPNHNLGANQNFAHSARTISVHETRANITDQYLKGGTYMGLYYKTTDVSIGHIASVHLFLEHVGVFGELKKQTLTELASCINSQNKKVFNFKDALNN